MPKASQDRPYVEGRGGNAREVKRVKFKLADKRAALVDIGRHLGMFKDRLDLSGDVDQTDNDQIIAQILGLAPPERPADEAQRGRVVSGKAQRGLKAGVRSA